jgi:hypothetical protein
MACALVNLRALRVFTRVLHLFVLAVLIVPVVLDRYVYISRIYL